MMVRLWRRLASLERALWMSSLGALALSLSALMSWSAHPSASRSWISTAGELVPIEDLFAIDVLLRLAVFVGGLLFLVVAWRGGRPARRYLRAAWILPAAVLALPCWLAHYYPERMLERKLLYQEMNRVADDMDTNLAQQQMDWRVWQTFSRATVSRKSSLGPLHRTWYPEVFSPTRANRLLEEVLGFSPEFLGFFGPALPAAVFGGMGLLLCGLHLASNGGWREVWRGLPWALLTAGVFMAVPLGPRIVAEYHLVAGEAALSRGDSLAASEHLRTAQFWKPGLRYSWSYHHRLGQLSRLQDRPTALETLLAAAYDALVADRPQTALERLYQAQTLYPEERSIDRFIAVTLAEAGIGTFNQGQLGLAKDYWQESLRYLPTNPMPWYGLSLVYGLQRRYNASARCLDQLVRLQDYLGYRRLPVHSQALVIRSWAASHRGDLPAAHELYSRSLNPDAW